MRADLARADAELPPAPPMSELASGVTPADEVPADRLATVTIPRTLSPKEKRRQRIAKAFRWISLLTVLAVAGWAVWTFVIPHPTTVPDLVGDPLARAELEADQAGLELVRRQEFNSDIPSGQVISQSLPAGSEAEQGDSLTVVLSLGPELAAVPSVAGLELDEATERLEKARFKVSVEREYHDTIAKDHVIRQNPDGASELEVGKQVRLTVSKGPQPFPLPDLSSQTEQQAKAALSELGLRYGVVKDYSTVPVGEVIGTDPPAGTTVEAKAFVTIHVSKGPRTFAMPNVIGKPSGEAIAQLEALDLVVDAEDIPGSEGDTIVGQLPKAGTTVQQGDTVMLYIGG
jgi:serine/threonine-protein kinase